MIVQFKTKELEKLYYTLLNELKGKQKYSRGIIKQYKRKVQLLEEIKNLEELRPFKGLNFEYLKGDREGDCSIKLNDQFRLIFEPQKENSNAITIILITKISKHYE